MRSTRPLAVIAVAVALVASAAAAQERVLLDESSGAVLPTAGHARLRIAGLSGTLSIRAAREGELRWEARDLDTRRQPRTVALWEEGSTLIFGPATDAAPDERTFIEIAVSPRLDVEVELGGGTLHASGLFGRLSVSGSGDVDARALEGSVEAQLTGGSVRLEAIGDGVTLSGSELAVDLRSISNFVSLALSASTAKIDTLTGTLDADLEQTDLSAARVTAETTISAVGGRIGLSDGRREVRLQLEDAPLELVGQSGRIDVDTDADVQFRDVKGQLTIRSYGGAIRGSGCEGSVELTTSDAEVNVENVSENVVVHGDALRVRLRSIKGETTVAASGSSVLVEDSGGAVDVQTDYGDVVVQKAAGPVKISSRNGEVRLAELVGPVQVQADGGDVEAGWASMQLEGDSVIDNANGDVRLLVPSNAQVKISAEADYGTVESSVPGIEVADDGVRAIGAIGRGARGSLKITSVGSVSIAPLGASAGQ